MLLARDAQAAHSRLLLNTLFGECLFLHTRCARDLRWPPRRDRMAEGSPGRLLSREVCIRALLLSFLCRVVFMITRLQI